MLNSITRVFRLLPVLLLILLVAGCSRKSPKVYLSEKKAVAKGLDSIRLKYSIQAGAFRSFKNAVNYRNRLAADADAYGCSSIF